MSFCYYEFRMRFLENGPILPDELLFAQDEGQVVFFCGAGVSKARVGLPSFEELADSVLSFLGSTHDSKERQLLVELQKSNSQEHTKGLISADHIFDTLTRNFVEYDINRAVAQTLIPPTNPDLSAHKIILKLAKLIGGQTRLITTNFDLLFESSNKKIKFSTRSNLPRIQYSDNDWGIVHLHGRVKSDYSGPDQDGFVLSSAEFGDAYLAQGWARDFVKDVLDRYMAVFIGYSADDPPIRYLLKGLQQSNSFQHKVYAFQVGPDDEAVAQWHEKGVEAIVYERGEDQNHDSLWNTLKAWGDRTTNPTRWKKKVFSKARKGPSKLLPYERGMVAHLINSQSGARALEMEHPPLPSEWLCVFDPLIRSSKSDFRGTLSSDKKIVDPYQLYALDDDAPPPGQNIELSNTQPIPSDAWSAFSINEEDRRNLREYQVSSLFGYNANHIPQLPPRLIALADWIVKVSHQSIAIWWAGQQESLHPGILKGIQIRMQQDKNGAIPNAVKAAWCTILELNNFSKKEEYEEYQLINLIEASGWNPFVISEYCRISAPILKSGQLYNRFIPHNNIRKIESRNLISIEVEYPTGIYQLQIPDEYLGPIINCIRINLEKAVDLEIEFSSWLDFCAIEADENIEGQDFSRGYKLSGYVLHFVNLFRRFIEIDSVAARIEFNKWRKTDPVFTRLRIWASGVKGFISGEEFATEIISLDQEGFWPFRGERDLLLALRNRWKELSSKSHKLIERKILLGPKKLRTIKKEVHERRSAHWQLNRLHWLKSQGCKLTLDLNKITQKLLKKSPEWKPEYAKKAADSQDGQGGVVKIDTSWSGLESLPVSDIIDKAEKLKGKNYEQLTEFDPFSGLSDGLPLKALSALSLSLKKGQFRSDYWEKFLSRESRRNDSIRLMVLTGGRIAQISNFDYSNILLTASRWFELTGPSLRKSSPRIFKRVWDKFINTIIQHPESARSAILRNEDEIEWVTEAINSPSGELASLLMADPAKNGFEIGKGYPKKWITKLDQLLALPDDAHRYVMVILAFYLSWSFDIDPSWTEEKLLHVLEDDKSDAHDKEAIWSGFLWGARVPQVDLYLRLKPLLLDMAYKTTSRDGRQVEILSGILLAGWISKDAKDNSLISNEEFRNVLLNAGDNFRDHVLWQLQRWAEDKDSSRSNDVLEFLKEVWPKHKKIRTQKVSASLCDIALKFKTDFPSIASLVTQLVTKIGNQHIFIPEMRKTRDNIASKYPEDLLNLLYAVLPENSMYWPYGAREAIKAIEDADPKLLKNPKLIELKSRMLGV